MALTNLKTSDNSKIRVPSRKLLPNLPYYSILIIWALITIIVFVWVVSSSLKTNKEVFKDPWALPSSPLTAGAANYLKAWEVSHMQVYFLNSVMVVIASVLIVVTVSAPAAYVLSRIPFFGSEPITYYFIAGMGLPFQLILVPLFVLLNKLSLINTLQGLSLVYIGVSIPFTVLLLTGFFRTLPVDLEDAAAIDGCSDFGIFWKVMVPLGAPGLITAAIFNFISIWNEYLLAMLLINVDKLRTLPLGVMNIRYSMQYTADWSALFAAVVIVIIPNFLLYIFLSDRLISGLTLGAGK
jgi:ABC-type glycerol-3-phosphate transport system permease component